MRGRRHSNFEDPLGLVMRMLASGDRAARSALYLNGFELILTPVDMLLQPLERRRLDRSDRAKHPLIQIVGPPRSGTTLVYQTLAFALPVSFFTNLSALFTRSPVTASALFWRPVSSGRPNFHSFYGNTAGLGAPNDGFQVWNRWLGTDRYAAPRALDDEAADDMRRFVAAWVNAFNRPLLNKNNRTTDCVSLLDKTLDAVWFVAVRRDPLFVAQSLVVARERVQGDRTIGWGLGAHASEPEGTDPLKDVARQVAYIHRRMEEEKLRVDPTRFLEIDYENFCREPARVVSNIHARIFGDNQPVNARAAGLRPFEIRNRRALPESEFALLRSHLGKAFEAEGLQQ